jgi:hypothetical protein
MIFIDIVRGWLLAWVSPQVLETPLLSEPCFTFLPTRPCHSIAYFFHLYSLTIMSNLVVFRFLEYVDYAGDYVKFTCTE